MAFVTDELLLVVRSNVTQALAGLSAVSGAMSKLGGAEVAAKLGKAGKAFLPLTLATAGVAAVAGKTAADFEKSMSQIKALVGVPEAEMGRLSEAALSMGADFGVSAKDAAGGLFFLKSAGLDTDTAIETLKMTAQASAIGLGDMQDLANTATTAMTNFGDSGVDAAAAFDDIATAARLAKADPSDLGRIMNNNSASAALVGMSYEDLGGSLALLTRKFGNTRKAGTGMEGILRKLIKPSAMAKDMLDSVGISAAEFQSMLAEDLPGGLATLDAAFADNGVSQSEWLGKVFEDGEAIKAAAAVIQTSGSEVTEIYDGMADAQGSLKDGWETMSSTASVQFAQMKESIVSALIPVGKVILEDVLPIVKRLADGIAGMLDWFNGLSPIMQDVVLAFATLVAAIGPALIIGSKVIGAIQGINAAMLFLAANPVVLTIMAVVAALAVLGLGIAIVVKHWDEIKVAVGKAWDWIIDKVSAAVNWVIGLFEDFINKHIEGLNILIGAINKIPGVHIDPIEAVHFGRIARDTADDTNELTKAIDNNRIAHDSWLPSIDASQRATEALTVDHAAFNEALHGTTAAIGEADGAQSTLTTTMAAGEEQFGKYAETANGWMTTTSEIPGTMQYVQGAAEEYATKFMEASTNVMQTAQETSQGVINEYGKMPDAVSLSAQELLDNLTVSGEEYDQWLTDLTTLQAMGFGDMANVMRLKGPEFRDTLHDMLVHPELIPQITNEMYANGEAVGFGLASGLASPAVLAEIDAANAKLMERVAGGAQKNFEISSPSKLMAREVGKPIGQGVIVGFEGSMDGLDTALREATNVKVPSVPTTRQPAFTAPAPRAPEAATPGPQTIVVQIGDDEFARFVLDKTGLGEMRTARRQR